MPLTQISRRLLLLGIGQYLPVKALHSLSKIFSRPNRVREGQERLLYRFPLPGQGGWFISVCATGFIQKNQQQAGNDCGRKNDRPDAGAFVMLFALSFRKSPGGPVMDAIAHIITSWSMIFRSEPGNTTYNYV